MGAQEGDLNARFVQGCPAWGKVVFQDLEVVQVGLGAGGLVLMQDPNGQQWSMGEGGTVRHTGRANSGWVRVSGSGVFRRAAAPDEDGQALLGIVLHDLKLPDQRSIEGVVLGQQ